MKHSAKRLTVEAVLRSLRHVQGVLLEKKLAQQSCITSWGQRKTLSESHPEIIKWTADDDKHRTQALAGYERDVAELEVEVKTWQDALSHALDALEGRA